jgi:hypothetical protein
MAEEPHGNLESVDECIGMIWNVGSMTEWDKYLLECGGGLGLIFYSRPVLSYSYPHPLPHS